MSDTLTQRTVMFLFSDHLMNKMNKIDFIFNLKVNGHIDDMKHEHKQKRNDVNRGISSHFYFKKDEYNRCIVILSKPHSGHFYLYDSEYKFCILDQVWRGSGLRSSTILIIIITRWQLITNLVIYFGSSIQQVITNIIIFNELISEDTKR